MNPDPDHGHAHQESLESLLDLYATTLLPALDRFPMPAWITDSRGQVRWANACTGQMFGRTTGVHFSNLIARERVNDARELFARKVLGSTDATVHKSVLASRGTRLSVEMTSVPLHSDGSVVGVLTISRPEEAAPVAQPAPPPDLTPRQHETLEYLAHGYSTTEIAGRMQVAEDTARNHIRSLLRELGVHSRLEAVVKAFRSGWL
jgi:DNA-binding NarL/FixJ family response regulator